MPEPAKRPGLTNLLTRLMRGSEAPVTTPERAPEKPTLRVTTHVARDLLQNAAYFNSVPKAVAEYVTNAIDNALPGKPVHCEVSLARDAIRISDNASGMTYTELSNFFQMHGENVQRQRGRAVRGRFGTGKSAAFGIAGTLQVETVKGGKRNVVELSRADVMAAKDGQPIPVREVVANEGTRARTGTTIVIKDIHAKNVDADVVRGYLEKVLGRHLRLHEVIVNGTQCQYHEPASVKTYRFKAPRETAEQIGSATCILKISQAPLTREENTVAILCNGFLHANTLAGKQADPFIEYVFGEVEVPSLDADTGPTPAFDNTRNLTLNMQNPRVQALLAWLAGCLEEVRQELVARDKRRRYSREMRLLRKFAGEIQGVLDDDFRVVQETLPWATMPGARRRGKAKRSRGSDEIKITPTGRTQTLIERGRALVNRLLGRPEDEPGVIKAPPSPRRGGRVEFEINYARLGADSPRARYVANRRAIYLNRDHPQMRAAEAEAGLQSVTFKMLSFDVAATDYALAVVSQLADQGVEVADPIDASEMVQEILDRLGRKAAEKFYVEGALPPEAPTKEEEEKEEGAEEKGEA